uniref:Mannan-binding lectin serine peptidase 1 n=1 Tax=Electrophorus electricus TaxID=8005 RepID=A0AAY5EZW5_ELEEL
MFPLACFWFCFDVPSALLPVLFLPASPAWAQVLLLADMYGTIQSPNFPESYPKDNELQWNVTVPSGYTIRLYFMHFDIEPSYLCEYDYVKVYSETEELAAFCGRENTDTERVPADDVILSPGSMLSVAFRSDFSNEERHSGFEAHYSAVDIDECRGKNDEELACDHFCHNYIGGYYCSCRYGYQLHSDNRTCKVECSDSVYTERSGLITSSDFPKPYPKSSDCVYRIEVEEGFLVTLDFEDSFDIEDHPEVPCPYDYIKIEAGARVFGPFCGDRPPDRIQTLSNSVSIRFHSDNSGENLGWKLTYASAGSECPVLLAPPNGHLEPLQSQYLFKEHITVTCDPGYSLQKVKDTDSLWPQCMHWHMGLFLYFSFGSIHLSLSKDGEEFEHYQIKCQTDGTWSVYTCGQSGLWVRQDGASLPQKRIVGGRTAPEGLFPWQVLLSVKDVSRVPVGRWFGSGALLSPTWVLTAAHVLSSPRRDPSIVPVAPEHVRATVGLTNHLILHPHFDPRNYDNDIALVRLQQEVVLGDLVRPVCLPAPPLPAQALVPTPGALGVVAGWGISAADASGSGLTSDPGVVSEVLQYVKLPVVAQEECEASYASRSLNYNITANMFCAGFYEGGRDTCLGDSGGAFVMEDPRSGRWVAHGLVSWAGPEECGSERVYGVYTRVANYVHWLHAEMNTEH